MNMLTVKQAAEKIGVSAGLVYGLCAAGKIRHERFGLGRGTIRIPDEAMDEFRQSCVQTGAERLAPLPLKHLKMPSA